VPPPGFEPGTTVPKTVVISISLQGQYNTYYGRARRMATGILLFY
jgi:hypothetical protein